MYTPPWIPRRDDKFSLFAQAFCNGINNDPARYMVTPAEAASLMQRLQVFLDAFAVATNPATRTSGTIATKQDARSNLQDSIETQGAFIRINLGISDGDKIGIGVRPRNISHRKRICPTTSPLLDYIGSLPGMDQLVSHDSNTPTSKAKPYGAERLELWVAYMLPGEPTPKREDARPIGTFKRSKMLVKQDPQRDVRQGASGPAPGIGGTGMPIYWARWLGHDGQTGPWSLPLFTMIKARPAKPASQAVEGKPGAEANDVMKMAA